MRINGRLDRAERAAASIAPQPRTLTIEEADQRLRAAAAEIASEPARLADFLAQVDQASLATADIANEYFNGQTIARDGGAVYVWLWLAIFNGQALDIVEAWASHNNFFNLTSYQAQLYQERRANDQL